MPLGWFLVLRTKVVLYEMFLARVEIVDVSESLAKVTETTLCNVSEGRATISDAATILFLAIKTDVQEPTLSLGVCGSFPHVTGKYTSTLQALWDCWFHILCKQRCSHLQLHPTCCHVLAMGRA